jgi:toxin ParE1/3/4
MLRYRLSDTAQVDVINILAWTHEQFGEAARLRYESPNSGRVFDRGTCD